MSEKFSLKWYDFQLNASTSFKNLRNQKHFYDVTLVSDDQKQVSAHKVVLSACSEYFSNILKQNTHSHPFICLDGVSSTDLNNMLDYVYLGEVQIFQDDLNRFIKVAQKFRLEGLLQSDQNEETLFQNTNKNNEEKMIHREDNVPMYNTDTEDGRYTGPKVEKIIIDDGSDLSKPEELKKKIEQMYTKGLDSLFRCTVCGKTSRRKDNMKEHVEYHIEGLNYRCVICGKVLKSSGSLRTHKIKNHY